MNNILFTSRLASQSDVMTTARVSPFNSLVQILFAQYSKNKATKVQSFGTSTHPRQLVFVFSNGTTSRLIRQLESKRRAINAIWLLYLEFT